MVREVFDIQSSVGFLPPRSSHLGWKNFPNNNLTQTHAPTTIGPCRPDNQPLDAAYNFSADLLCELLRDYREPNILDPRTKAIVITGYATLIAIGIVSNVLVCCVVLRQTSHNSSHISGKSRNLYILNLAVADLALCCICMPLTLHSLLNFDWTMGVLLCKLAPVIQATNMLVSAGTITAIALDRYDTIVRSSRKRRLSHTNGRSIASGIAIVWLLSLLLTSPLFFYTQIESVSIHGVFLYDKCVEQWPSDTLRIVFSFVLTGVQFVIPVCVLSTIHTKISSFLKLHLRPAQRPSPKIEIHSPDPRNDHNIRIPTDDETVNEEKQPLQKEFLNIKRKESICSENSQRSESSRKNSDCSDSKRLSTPDISPRKNSNLLSSLRENSDFSFSFSKLSRESSRKSPKGIRRELRRNRRTTLLLSCIASVYAISWLPYNVYNIATNIDTFGLAPDTLYKAFIAAHLLAMTSVCVNPFLYGWLNTNFRREFRQLFSPITNSFTRLFNCQRLVTSSSYGVSKLFKKSSKIINGNAYNDAAMMGLQKKTVLSFIPSSKQADSVRVAIYSDGSQLPPL